MNKLLTAFLIGFLLLGVRIGLCKDLKIAVVDIQRVVRESRAGRDAMKVLQAKFERFKQDLEKKKRELERFKQELERRATLLSEEARMEEQRRYSKMLKELKEAEEEAQYELQREEKRLLKPILKKLEEVLKEFAEREGFDLILDKNTPGLYWVSERVDITQRLLKLFNERYETKESEK